MLWPAPQVHFSLPGTVMMSLGHAFTTLYGPNMSWPPTAPGFAEKPAPGRGASTADVVWAISNPATQPMTAAPNAKACLRMVFLSRRIRAGEVSQSGGNGDG